MRLRYLTGENFGLTMHMPQIYWSGFHVLYDHALSEERRAAMLHTFNAQVLTGNEGRIPPITRIELHATSNEGVQGYVVVVFEKLTKVFEYTTEDMPRAEKVDHGG
jgi:hypothetical protein